MDDELVRRINTNLAAMHDNPEADWHERLLHDLARARLADEHHL